MIKDFQFDFGVKGDDEVGMWDGNKKDVRKIDLKLICRKTFYEENSTIWG